MRLPTTLRLALAGAILVLQFPGWAWGQRQLESETDLKQAFDKSRDSVSKLLNTKSEPGVNDMPGIHAVCKWYVYRTNLPTWLNRPDDMANAIKEYNGFIDRVGREGKPGMVNAVGRSLTERFREIFGLEFLENRQTCIYAAVMLPAAAKLKQDDFAAFLIELIQDPKRHDAIRLYACKGLKEYFPVKLVTDFDDPKDAKIQGRRAKDNQRVQVLLDFLDRKWPVSEGTSKMELDAISYVRKEAIAALANVQSPVVYIDKKGTRIEGPAVHGLVKVLLKDGLYPLPSVAEKCEAAYGLCGLKATPIPDYQGEASVYLVGQALLAFADAYQKDWVNLGGLGKDKKLPRLPYKIHAERFLQGLQELQVNTRDTPANQLAKRLQDSAREMLTNIKFYRQINVQDLQRAVTGMRPKTGTLFKNVKDQPQFDFGM